jgi:hypothetical protein
MPITTEIRQTVDEARAAIADPKRLQAVAGAGDVLVQRVRAAAAAAAAQQKSLQSIRFEPSTVPSFLNARFDSIRGAVAELPERAQGVVAETVARANSTYDDLAKRGTGIIHVIGRQRATQDLIHLIENTLRSVRTKATPEQGSPAVATPKNDTAPATKASPTTKTPSATATKTTAAAKKTSTTGKKTSATSND